MAVSKRTQINVMKCIVEFYDNAPSDRYIAKEYLISKKACKAKDLQSVMRWLIGSELIIYHKDYPNSPAAIKLSPKGMAYLEDQAEKKKERRKQNLHNWKIAIFTAIAGALLSKPIWDVIGEILEQILS